jgi:hypothetical protein
MPKTNIKLEFERMQGIYSSSHACYHLHLRYIKLFEKSANKDHTKQTEPESDYSLLATSCALWCMCVPPELLALQARSTSATVSEQSQIQRIPNETQVVYLNYQIGW